MSYLYRANSSASGTTATISAWVKKVDLSGDEGIFQFKSGSDMISCYINPVVKFRSSISGSTSNGILEANRKIRDFSAWFHVCAVIDTTNATAGDRLRLFINGERITSWSTETYPSQNYVWTPVSGGNFELGKYSGTDAPTYLAHVHYCDGYAYNADTFGSTDSATGEWKINTNPTVNYGSNGVFLKFASSGAMGTDSSGNSNTMSISGSCLQTQDNCSNNFCTLQPLYNQTTGQGVTLGYGNTKCSYSSNNNRSAFGTIAISSGKYYFEAKNASAEQNMMVGIGWSDWSDINGASGYAAYDNTYSVLYYASGGNKYVNTSSSSYGDSYTNGDIVGVAIDLDNNFAYFSKNGVWQNSGVPTSGSTGTGGIAITAGKSYIPAVRMKNGTQIELNFGNGYFGGTAISSAGSNASGFGTFEYDVPNGFTALCTKGLNE